jgi:Leucine-rich repeat (LRR) protein
LLYCNLNQLTELKGLENLFNLKQLDCRNNKLTELDTSNLINLEWLNGEEYIQPMQDKLDLLTNRVEKLEQDIAEIKTKIRQLIKYCKNSLKNSRNKNQNQTTN